MSIRIYDETWLLPSVAADLRRRALAGFYDGWMQRTGRYLDRCRGFHLLTGSVLIFTRDQNMHGSGWWKNPDYERCWHLSLSFRDPVNGDLAPRNCPLTRRWLEAFFGADRRMLWCEPPYSPEGKAHETWHYRLFCDERWEPIIPRGEVYSKEFTELGWKSFSQVQTELGLAEENIRAMLADASSHQAAEG